MIKEGEYVILKKENVTKAVAIRKGRWDKGQKILFRNTCAYMELFKALALGYRIQSHFYTFTNAQEYFRNIVPLFCSCSSIVGMWIWYFHNNKHHVRDVPFFYPPPPPHLPLRMAGIWCLKFLLASFEEKKPRGWCLGGVFEKLSRQRVLVPPICLYPPSAKTCPKLIEIFKLKSCQVHLFYRPGLS